MADTITQTEAMKEASEFVVRALTEAAEVEGLSVADRAFFLRSPGSVRTDRTD